MMGKALAVVKTIDDLVSEVAKHVFDLNRAQKRCDDLRLSVGRKLVELRGLVEASGADWWDWWDANRERMLLSGRKDCERLLRIASADDPEAAIADERAKDRDRKRMERTSAPSDAPEIVSDEVADAAFVLDHALDSLDGAKALAEAYRKIFKKSSFDREAKEQIRHAIKLLIIKWRTAESALDKS
jgi:hypothetical protein